MVTSAIRVDIDDYFRLNIKPDCELVEGELRQKPMGTREHMRLELRVVAALRRFEARGWGEAIHELSIRFADNSVLIPDVVFTWPDQPVEEHGALSGPPRLCVEILSPSQTAQELFAKCGELHKRGVPVCWILDPIHRRAWEFAAGAQPVEVRDGLLRAGEIEIDAAELFA